MTTAAFDHKQCISFTNAAVVMTISGFITTRPPPLTTADIGHRLVGEKITLLEFGKK